jgi:uncharacterized protein YndB with AHSA1/START domain
MRFVLAAAAFAAFPGLLAGPAQAEVVSATPQGFEVRAQATVATSPQAVWAMLGRIERWWSPDHSYSGKAANLSLKPEVGGCFCEALDGGGRVEHLRVVYAAPGKTLRLQGGLGPLQGEGAAGSLTWTLKAVPAGTEISQTYVVGGYIRMGAEKLAPLVDGVMKEQLGRLAGVVGK